MKDIKWFKEAKYGLMLHFGLYSMLGGVYKGERSHNYSEWIQSACAIPNKEMEKMATALGAKYFFGFEFEDGTKV